MLGPTKIAVGSDRYMAPEQYDPIQRWLLHSQSRYLGHWHLSVECLSSPATRLPCRMPRTPSTQTSLSTAKPCSMSFPSMSQDTFEVLMPLRWPSTPRSVTCSLVKDALIRAISFTTDDESLDEFCTDDCGRPVIASANREPLRTPSISTPQLDQGGSFPWAKALAMSPPQPIRQLSAIPDTEVYADELFPGSVQSNNGLVRCQAGHCIDCLFCRLRLGSCLSSPIDTDPVSSPINITRSRPMPISGSLPVDAARPFNSMASVFGKKRDAISKSWSDLWDEEEEEGPVSADFDIAEVENNYTPFGRLKQEVTLLAKTDQAYLLHVAASRSSRTLLWSTTAGAALPRTNRLKQPSMLVNRPDSCLRNTLPLLPKYSPPSKRDHHGQMGRTWETADAAPNQQQPKLRRSICQSHLSQPQRLLRTPPGSGAGPGAGGRPINWGPTSTRK